MSIPIYWPDEFAFIKYNDIIYKSATPAISKVSEFAERDGRPHGKIISTTPANVDTPAGKFCKSLIDDGCEFLEDMYDWTRERILNYITDNSSNDFLYIKYTWQQLGLTQAWYDKLCRELTNDWLIIRREVDLVWTKSSDNSVFDEKTLDAIFALIDQTPSNMIVETNKVIEATGEVRKAPYSFILHKPIDPSKVYFIGVDTAGGLDRDFSTIVITDPMDSYKPVATFKNNKINVEQFARLLIQLIKVVTPRGVLFIESNNYGKGVIDIIVDVIPKNIYYEYKIQDKDKTKVNPSTVTRSISYGISTTGSSRPLMMDALKEIINDTPEQIVSQDIYENIKGLVYTKAEKIEHDDGMHDDVLFAYLMVQYAIRYGNNIAKFLRDIKNVKGSIDSLVNITSNDKNTQNLINDPAYNKGMDINFAELVRMVGSGENFEIIKARLEKNAGNKGNPGRPATEINTQLIQSMLTQRR